MTPELHHILAQERHEQLMRAAERARAAAGTQTPAWASRPARSILRFIPPLTRFAPSRPVHDGPDSSVSNDVGLPAPASMAECGP